MIAWRIALAFLPELQHIAKWIGGVLFGLFVITGISVGIYSQTWSPWWFAGNTQAPPGSVPIDATLPPQGPLPVASNSLMAHIEPWLGTPYVFGGCTLRGVDCSCFTQNVARAMGTSLPRTAQLQWNATERTASPVIGDLVFFERTYSSPDRITHVGFYIGDGWMISAVEPVLGRQSINSPFWRSHFAGFGRVRYAVPNQA
jgi:hypothetical protein